MASRRIIEMPSVRQLTARIHGSNNKVMRRERYDAGPCRHARLMLLAVADEMAMKSEGNRRETDYLYHDEPPCATHHEEIVDDDSACLYFTDSIMMLASNHVIENRVYRLCVKYIYRLSLSAPVALHGINERVTHHSCRQAK